MNKLQISQPRRQTSITMHFNTGAGIHALHKLDQIAPKGMVDIEGNCSNELNKGFFARLFTSRNERNFIDGCLATINNRSRLAYNHFSQSIELADGAFMAGYFAFRFGENEKALTYFKSAINQASNQSYLLGYHFRKYETEMQLKLPISDDIYAVIAPNIRGAVLGLAEVYQKIEHYDEAIQELRRLRKSHPRDCVVLISLLDVLYDHNPANKANLENIMDLSNKYENNNFTECAILLYRAKAALALKQAESARIILTKALSRRKDRPSGLHCALHLERASANKALNKNAAANADLQNVYAVDSNYKDIRQRLGI